MWSASAYGSGSAKGTHTGNKKNRLNNNPDLDYYASSVITSTRSPQASKEASTNKTLTEKIRIAAEGLTLTNSQQACAVAHRLTREFMSMPLDTISVDQVRQLIQKSTLDLPGAVAPAEKNQDAQLAAKTNQPESNGVVEIDEEAYRANHIVNTTRQG